MLRCGVLQCSEAQCNVLSFVAVCCSVLQLCCNMLQCVADVYVRASGRGWMGIRCVAVVLQLCCSGCSVLQCVAVCCSVVQCGAVCCSVLQLCCSCVAVCCSCAAVVLH